MAAFTEEPMGLLEMENTVTVAYNIVTSAPPRNQMSRPQDHYKYVVFIFGFITFCCGIIGNSLVIYILLRFRDVRVKSVANYYILNLAFSDQAFILSLPFFAYSSFVGEWIFGNPMCKIAYVLREINKFASIFTLVALSIDRYLASYHNLSHFRTIRVGKFVCLLIWTSSLAMCMPYIMYSHSIPYRGGNSCKINWPQPVLPHLRAWIYSQFSLGMVLPFALISISYILLLRRLRAIMKPRGADRIRKPNRKMTRTVLVVFTTFLICQVSGLWAIYCVFWISHDHLFDWLTPVRSGFRSVISKFGWGLMSWELTGKLISVDCHGTPLATSQHWCR